MNLEFKNGASTLVSLSPVVAGVILDYHGNIWQSSLNTWPFCIALADTYPNYNVRIPVHLLGQREGYPSFAKGDFWGCNGFAQLGWCTGTVAPGDLLVAEDNGVVSALDITSPGDYIILGQCVSGGTDSQITFIDCVPHPVSIS